MATASSESNTPITSGSRPFLSVVIPVYNSQETLRELTQRLETVFAACDVSAEIVFVDDCSSDGSWQILSELQQSHADTITAIQLMRNFGQHNALMCGLRRASGQFIVTMDDDLQNPPEEIPRLMQAIASKNLDLVYGRYETKEHAWSRNLGSAIVNLFFRMVFQTQTSVTSFRVMRFELVQSILSYDLNFTSLDGLLSWNTRRIDSTPVRHDPRKSGRTGYSLRKLINLALNLFTNFSLLPLQVVSFLGLLAATGGFITGLYYLVQALLNQITVPGYASVIIAVLVLGGLQLLALGIIGEYLGRVHLNINRKPQYTERQVLSASDK